jgi:hypothetical protein
MDSFHFKEDGIQSCQSYLSNSDRIVSVKGRSKKAIVWTENASIFYLIDNSVCTSFLTYMEILKFPSFITYT